LERTRFARRLTRPLASLAFQVNTAIMKARESN